MPTFDSTGYDLIAAGELAAAETYLENNHPDAYVQTTGYATQALQQLPWATSGSTHDLTVGTKVFLLDSAREWPDGAPVLVYTNANSTPTQDRMWGYVVSRDGAEVTVEIEQTGTGAAVGVTSWILGTQLAVTYAPTGPPVSVADGGTNAGTETGARASLETGQTVSVVGLAQDPPVAPGASDYYIVFGSATGDLAGHENELARSPDGGTTWNFFQPDVGAFAHDLSTDTMPAFANSAGMYRYTGISNGLDDGGVWDTSEWIYLSGRQPPRGYQGGGFVTGGDTLTVDQCLGLHLYRISGTGTITLPNPATNGELYGSLVRFHVLGLSPPLNLAVSGGGQLVDSGFVGSAPVSADYEKIDLFFDFDSIWISRT